MQHAKQTPQNLEKPNLASPHLEQLQKESDGNPWVLGHLLLREHAKEMVDAAGGMDEAPAERSAEYDYYCNAAKQVKAAYGIEV
jgi:hypothetical protein